MLVHAATSDVIASPLMLLAAGIRSSVGLHPVTHGSTSSDHLVVVHYSFVLTGVLVVTGGEHPLGSTPLCSTVQHSRTDGVSGGR